MTNILHDDDVSMFIMTCQYSTLQCIMKSKQSLLHNILNKEFNTVSTQNEVIYLSIEDHTYFNKFIIYIISVKIRTRNQFLHHASFCWPNNRET